MQLLKQIVPLVPGRQTPPPSRTSRGDGARAARRWRRRGGASRRRRRAQAHEAQLLLPTRLRGHGRSPAARHAGRRL